jgi:hypothetical protein
LSLARIAETVLGSIVVFPFMAAVCVAPLLLAQHWWGRWGLWVTSIVWWTWFAGVAAYQSWQDLATDPVSLIAFVAVFVALVWTPAAFIDRATTRSPASKWQRRLGWGVLGFFAGLAGAFALMAVVGGAIGLYKRLIG